MMTPSIHLNGTSREALVEGYTVAYTAVGAAIEALQQAYPNARDYYVQGPEAFAAARREHEARLHKLADVAAELLALGQAVIDA